MRILQGSAGWVLMMLLCSPVLGGTDDDLLEILRDNKTLTPEQYEKIKNKQEEKARNRYRSKFRFGDEEGDFKLKVGGRLQVDGAVYDDNRDLGDGTEIRRARIELAAILYERWRVETSYDFAGDKTSVKDAWIGYTGIRSTLIQVGQFKEPFSLEELTSSRYITFMERALPNAFAPGRNIGAAVNFHGANSSFAAGVFGEGAGAARADGEGYAVTGRATFAPVAEVDRVVHFGIAGTHRVPEDQSQSVIFQSRPESHVTATNLVSTGTLGKTDSFNVLGLEAAAVFGPLSLQGEYMRTDVDRKGPGLTDATFDGGYAFVSWFLTGEIRPYSARRGIFGNVEPRRDFGPGGPGALELVARFSFLDLNDDPVRGGHEENITAAFNWYFNPRIRLFANYIHVMTDPVRGDNDSNVYQMRLQAFF
ncbi:MAG: hypothetical protein COV67_06965 [Nitrospinae bacterium CG11_big_fil_rev_8_21_14_0_20_56_8]|nr:MAG: hypothetical protein COV67_06965 [Nitrospinae bacterium CG11_big_fil_rev_8_21_14_0_20_56_8]